MKTTIAVFLGKISYADAIQLSGVKDFPPEPYETSKFLPEFYHKMVSDKDYAATLENAYQHSMLINETAYLADSPADYYFDTSSRNGDVTQWEPDALI